MLISESRESKLARLRTTSFPQSLGLQHMNGLKANREWHPQPSSDTGARGGMAPASAADPRERPGHLTPAHQQAFIFLTRRMPWKDAGHRGQKHANAGNSASFSSMRTELSS